MIASTFSGLDLFVAYLDPGFSSMQFQIIVASLLSVSFFVKSSCSQAKDFLGRMLKKKTA